MISSSWKSISNKAGRRFRHSTFTYKDCVYILGGEYIHETFDFLFKFNTKTEEWSNIKVSTIFPDSIQNCTCNVYKNHVYILCGVDNTLVIPNRKLVTLNLDKEEWKILEIKNYPSPRYLHTTVLYGNSLFLFGGYFFTTFNDLFELDLLRMEFKEINYNGEILKRFNHISVVYNDSMYVYGGYSLNIHTPDKVGCSKWNNDLVEYHFEKNTFRKIFCCMDHQPIPRWGATGCMYQEFLVLFAGADDEFVKLNDLFIFDFKKLQWREMKTIEAPGSRWGHCSSIFN
jgi:N-acetylneuraminic acid mutarotase